jgi:phosphoribosyl 1,2-cyclic phosphodiesterase
MRFSLLGSGSSGNVAYVEAEAAGRRTRVLVDAGLCKAEIDRRLQRLPTTHAVSVADIDGVLLTHEHNDHAGFAATIGRPLWATAASRRALGVEATLVRAGSAFSIGALTVTPVGIPHDADETVGYVLSDGRCKLGILTDCGHETAEVAAAFAGCDVMVLEANHDAGLLRHGPYPPSLKRRVGGRLGHLSNDQAAALLKMMLQAGAPPKLVIAAHLSQANNRPSLAKSAFDRVLGRGGRVIVAGSRGTAIYSVAAGPPPKDVDAGGRDDIQVHTESMRHEQLTFAFAGLPGARTDKRQELR